MSIILQAAKLGCAFVPVRKDGKLPGEVLRASFEKEYGQWWAPWSLVVIDGFARA
jgi:adenine/guanine phosphoribosyltransferase-like PRPP-binding protein